MSNQDKEQNTNSEPNTDQTQSEQQKDRSKYVFSGFKTFDWAELENSEDDEILEPKVQPKVQSDISISRSNFSKKTEWYDTQNADALISTSEERWAAYAEEVGTVSSYLYEFAEKITSDKKEIILALANYIKYYCDANGFIDSYVMKDTVSHEHSFDLLPTTKALTPSRMLGTGTISSWMIGTLIQTVIIDTKPVIVTAYDIASGMLSRNTYDRFKQLGIESGMYDIANMMYCEMKKAFKPNSKKFTYVVTPLLYTAEGNTHYVVFRFLNTSFGLMHYIKLFTNIILMSFNDLLSGCTRKQIGDKWYVILPLYYILQLFGASLQSFSSMLKFMDIYIKNFSISKGSFCRFLSYHLESSVFYLVDQFDDNLKHDVQIVVKDQEVVDIVVPCKHCDDPVITNSIFHFSSDVVDPVTIHSNSQFSDANNPAFWTMSHSGEANKAEKDWLKSQLFSSSFDRSQLNFSIRDKGLWSNFNYIQSIPTEDNDGVCLVDVNLHYPTHHDNVVCEDDSFIPEHAHIRLSLCSTISFLNLLNGEDNTLIIPGHMYYLIDNMCKYLKIGFLEHKSNNFNIAFINDSKLMIKNVKTNLSYITLPGSENIISNCYKLHFILYLLKTSNDISEILLSIYTMFKAKTLINVNMMKAGKYKEQSVKYFDDLVKGSSSNDNSVWKRVIMSLITLDFDVSILNRDVFNSIYNYEDEFCDCKICDSFGISVTDKKKAGDILYNKLLLSLNGGIMKDFVEYLTVNEVSSYTLNNEEVSTIDASRLALISFGCIIIVGQNQKVVACDSLNKQIKSQLMQLVGKDFDGKAYGVYYNISGRYKSTLMDLQFQGEVEQVSKARKFASGGNTYTHNARYKGRNNRKPYSGNKYDEREQNARDYNDYHNTDRRYNTELNKEQNNSRDDQNHHKTNNSRYKDQNKRSNDNNNNNNYNRNYNNNNRNNSNRNNNNYNNKGQNDEGSSNNHYNSNNNYKGRQTRGGYNNNNANNNHNNNRGNERRRDDLNVSNFGLFNSMAMVNRGRN